MSVLSNLCEQPTDLNGGHPFKDGHPVKDGFSISKCGRKFSLHFVSDLGIFLNSRGNKVAANLSPTPPADFENGRGLRALASSPQR